MDSLYKNLMNGTQLIFLKIGLQQAFIFIFLYMAIQFQKRVKSGETPSFDQGRALRLLHIQYAVLALITVHSPFHIKNDI